MADAEAQYEDPRKFRDVGTVPKVSMFKRKSAEQEVKIFDENIVKTGQFEEPDLSLLFEEGGEFFLSDVGVQHDREMEDIKDVAIQFLLSMTDNSTQHELEMTDQSVGEHKNFVDVEIQSIASIFNLVSLFN
jgi:hypothetical protein